MKKSTKLRLQAGAESALYNMGAALGSVAYIVLSPIAAPIAAASRVHTLKNKAAKDNKQISGMKQFQIGTQTFFESFYRLPRGLFRMAKESVQESHDTRVNTYKAEHAEQLSERIEYLDYTGVLDLLKLVRYNNVSRRNIKFIKSSGDVCMQKCWCVDRFVIFMNPKNKQIGVFKAPYKSDNAIDAENYLSVPSDLYDDIHSELTCRMSYQERMAKQALDAESQANRERMARERQMREYEYAKAFKADLAYRARAKSK